MDKKWDGKERRKNPTDHDTQIQLIYILDNHVKNFNEHRTEFKEHIKDDAKRFDFLQKSVWMMFGGIAVLELFIKLTR